MEFSRQEYCSGLPFPSPGDLPDPGIEPRSPELQADSLLSNLSGKPHINYTILLLQICSCYLTWGTPPYLYVYVNLFCFSRAMLIHIMNGA